MPAKTPRDEKKWEKAVDIAVEHFGHKLKGDEWGYAMGIYKKMKPAQFKSSVLAKEILFLADEISKQT